MSRSKQIKNVWTGILVAVIAMASVTANAGSINWGAATKISGDSDVSTSGGLVYGLKAAGGSISEVNSTYFGFGLGSPYVSLSGIVNVSTMGTASDPVLSADYQAVVGSAAYGSVTTATVTLNGLTVGHDYQVQAWINDSRNYGDGRNGDISSTGGNTVNLDYNSTDGTGGNGQYSIGTFTADAATQAITLASSAPQLNAIQLRDLSATLPIEWSTVATVSGASDVSTDGDLAYAYTFGTANTVNTVPFVKASSTTDFDGSGNITASGWQAIAPAGTGGSGGMTGPYSDIINNFLYRDGTAATATLNNLTAGNTYQVQIWAQSNNSSRYQWVSGGDGAGAVALQFDMGADNGQYAIGSFVASSASETLRIWGNQSGQINAIQVRDLGVIPEPSTAILAGLGLAGLTLRRRRSA